MSDLLPPGNLPAPNADGDNTSDFPDFFASSMWPSMWPRMIHYYATTGARDADLAGLGPGAAAFAYVASLGRVTTWKGSSWHDPGAITSHSSVGGTTPVSVVGNTDGTVLQTLVIPAVTYGRILSVSMIAYVVSTQTADAWETVGTYDSNNIAINVMGRFRMTLNGASSAGSGALPSMRLILLANNATTLRVWVKRVAGTGTATGSEDHTYCNIQALAFPT